MSFIPTLVRVIYNRLFLLHRYNKWTILAAAWICGVAFIPRHVLLIMWSPEQIVEATSIPALIVRSIIIGFLLTVAPIIILEALVFIVLCVTYFQTIITLFFWSFTACLLIGTFLGFRNYFGGQRQQPSIPAQLIITVSPDNIRDPTYSNQSQLDTNNNNS